MLVHPLVSNMQTDEEEVKFRTEFMANRKLLEPNTVFSKKSLSIRESMKWMKDKEFILVSKIKPKQTYETTILVRESLIDLLDELEAQAPIHSGLKHTKEDNMKVFAMDLETVNKDLMGSALDTTSSLINGQLVPNTNIAGICIAINDMNGYYIPVRHNELDDIPNYTDDEVKEFLESMFSRDILQVYHNLQYDATILSVNGIVPNEKKVSDTMILSKLSGGNEYHKYKTVAGKYAPVGNGLKPLSQHLLHRPMIEIADMFIENGLMNPKTKKSERHIDFNILPATSATVYAVSDAINTFSLFKLFTSKTEQPYKDRNPYKVQNLATRMDMMTIIHTVSFLNAGVPADIGLAIKTVKTIIRRMILIEDRFLKLSGGIPVSSAEKVGIFVGGLLHSEWDKLDNSEPFASKALEDFDMAIKTTTLRDQSVKTTYGFADNVINNLESSINDLKWVSKEVKEIISSAIIYIQNYRSLQHEKPIYISMIRNSSFDNRGYSFFKAGLRPVSTDTTRSASAKGTNGLRLNISTTKTGKTSVSKVAGNGNTSLNIQGLSARPFDQAKIKKVDIDSLPVHIKESLNEMSRRVDKKFEEDLLLVK